MKVRVIGDIHGENWWKKLVSDIDKIDLCIFLGDYVDSYTVSDGDMIYNLLDIIQFKKNNPDKVILLYGNHEWNYLSPYMGYCSGFRQSIALKLKDILEENRELFRMIYKITVCNDLLSNPSKSYYFSHAGITQGWLQQNLSTLLKYSDISESEKSRIHLGEFLNSYNKSYRVLDTIMSISYYRGGRDLYGGPLWADLSESSTDFILHDPEVFSKDIPVHQYVGHTPVKEDNKVLYVDEETTSSIHYCDFGKPVDILINI